MDVLRLRRARSRVCTNVAWEGIFVHAAGVVGVSSLREGFFRSAGVEVLGVLEFSRGAVFGRKGSEGAAWVGQFEFDAAVVAQDT